MGNCQKKGFLLFLLLGVGCSSSSVRETKIIQIQRNRISNLEKQLSRKNREIQRLKLGRWLSPKRSPQPSLKFLRKLMLEGHWAKALQTSFDLRRDHPRWAELSSLRVQIFKKMGLNKQAFKEARLFERLTKEGSTPRVRPGRSSVQ